MENRTMTKEESIELAELLAEKYHQLSVKKNEAQKAFKTHEKAQERTNKPDRIYSPLAYFWPYLFDAVMIIVYVVYTCIFEGSFTPRIIALMVISVIVVTGYGLYTSKKWSDEKNKEIFSSRMTDEFRERKSKESFSDKERELASFKESVKEYDDLVPEKMRQKFYMEKVKKMLLSGEAENFTDAIAKLSNR